jgi:hypothetical protein
MTVVRGVALAAFALALCACGSSGHKAPARAVARKSATGRHASVTASYKFSVLADLSVHVEATPAQRVKGGWVVSCRDQLYQVTRESADYARQTPFDIPISVTPDDPRLTCEFVAIATLARSGRVRVELRGRHSS